MRSHEELMTALYHEHHGALVGFVSGYVRDRHRVEDAVQETLLRAWRSIDRIDTDSTTVRSYLLTVARNVLTDAWRAEQRRPELVGDDAAVERIPADDDVEGMVEGWLISAAMDRLSPEHRDVIAALYFEGRTVADAAQRLSIPEGTAKSRAYYAVRALRSAFEEMGMLR